MPQPRRLVLWRGRWIEGDPDEWYQLPRDAIGWHAAHEESEVAGHLSPVPGGVGPMTVAMLLRNTCEAALGSDASKTIPAS